MAGSERTPDRDRFSLGDDEKARKLARVRSRLQAATPSTQGRKFRPFNTDWQRTGMALVLLVILLVVLLHF